MLTWEPRIEVESAKGTREVALKTHHLMKRRIFLNGEIDAEMANVFLEQMLYMEESPEPVTILINSPGDEVNAGLMIYDIIRASKVPLELYCTGLAASMAALLLAAGEVGHRHILPHSKVMIHEPLISGGVGGSATSIHNIAESILATRKLTNDILAKHTGKPIQEIDAATAYDHYMDASQAVDFGICDDIRTRIA